MKNYLIKTLIILFILSLGVGYYYYAKVSKAKRDSEIALNNSIAERESLKGKVFVFEATIKQLKESKDSLDKKLLLAKKELGIKDNKLISMQYTIDHFKTVDSIVFKKDTIFTNMVNIDTTITNGKYYTLNLKLKYPSLVVVTPSFTIERATFFTSKRETIKEKKGWPWYIFQKKHTVVEVKIKDTNPFLVKDSAQSKYIYIVK